MMDEWGQPLKGQPKNAWDEEDVDEDDVKESWEDEDEAEAPPPPPPEKVKKPSAAPISKAADRKTKPEVANEVPLDPVAEKLRQQRLVEESDYQSTTELFSRKEDEKTIDTFIPKSETDFVEYAEMLSYKIRAFEKSFYYGGLLKAVLRFSMTSLKAADAKEIASSVSAIANEKLKAEREANVGKKKTGARKKQLHVGKDENDLVLDVYDGADDYDFM